MPPKISHQKKEKKISHHRKPSNLDLDQWQVALRKQFGLAQNFKLKNIGDHPIFSEFQVHNPISQKNYRVAIRGESLGDNYCSCPDFSINTLGTCKHIEFTLGKLRQKRGAIKSFAKGFQPEYSELFVKYGAYRKIVFRPGQKVSAAIMKLVRQYFDKSEKQFILRANQYNIFDRFLMAAKSVSCEIRCYEDVYQIMAQYRDQQHLEEKFTQLTQKKSVAQIFKPLVKVPLYRYQQKGALFLAKNGRAILADEMGLGKTIQAIAAAELLAKVSRIEKVLVICPTSLKYQWSQEIQKFTNQSSLILEGGLKKRKELYLKETFFKITNYDVIHRDLEIIEKWQPDLIILDEAQRIKNWKTRTAKTIKKLSSPYAFVLTGTPLENRLEEIHSIIEFIDRYRLGPLYRFLHDHQKTDENGKVIGYHRLDEINKSLKPVLLRRTKKEILKQLPKKLIKHFYVPMTRQQLDYHEENQVTVLRIVAKWRRTKHISETDRLRLMCALANMRMSCNSTYLLDRSSNFGCKVPEAIKYLEDVLESKENKVVIFSQWIKTHELLLEEFQKRNWESAFFHGGIASAQRKKLIQRFKEKPQCRLFLSTDAGGVGLNLQNASIVINMDQPWNPAILEQRIGRVHRLGQKRPVQVANFVAQGTIEHSMLDLLAFKKSLFAGVLDDGENEIFLKEKKLHRFMESIEQLSDHCPSQPEVAENDSTDLLESGKHDNFQDVPHSTTKQPSEPTSELDHLLSTGKTFFSQLIKILDTSQPAILNQLEKTQALGFGISLEQDALTQRKVLKLPVPKTETLHKISQAFRAFMNVMEDPK